MKIGRIIDFSGQTLVFMAVLISLIISGWRQDVLEFVLLTQLVMGAWQVVSSIITVGLRRRLYKIKMVHLAISVLYVSSLFVIPFGEFSREATIAIFIVPAWILAIFYYILTCVVTFQKRSRQSSFLPHTSF